MAMITSSVVPRLRGGFMGANSAIQHLSSSLGVIVAGLILIEPKNGPIERYTIVGLMAAAVSLSTLWLAGRLRLGDVAANVGDAELVKSQISAVHGQEEVLKPAVATRVVFARGDLRTPAELEYFRILAQMASEYEMARDFLPRLASFKTETGHS
jgi:hypothetical protein